MADEAPVQPIVYEVASGKPAPIPETEIPKAIASGKYAFAKGTQIPVIHPDTGEAGTIPSEGAYDAFKTGGYSLQPIADQMHDYNQEKYGGPLGVAEAGLAGAARGASFGLSDVALTKAGVKPETLKGLQEANPISSFGGEAVGVIAPALVGEEAGLAQAPGLLVKGVSKFGAAAERGAAKFLPEATSVAGNILKSATEKAVGLGAEGAAYGLGQSVSESALGDHDLLSEHTISNIGLSAALAGGLGGLFGAGMGLVGRDASSAVDKMAAQKIAEGAAPGSAEELISQTGLPAKEKSSFIDGLVKQKPNADEIVKAGQEIGAPIIPAQTSASDYVQSMSSALSQSPTIPGVKLQQDIQKGFEAVQNVVKDTLGAGEHLTPFEAGGQIKEQIGKVVDDMYAPIKQAYAEREALGHTIQLPDEARIKMAEGLEKMGQDFGSVDSKGGKLIAAYADRALAQNTVAQMDKLISEIGGEQRIAFRAGDTESAKALGQVTETLREFQIKEMAKQGRVLGKEGAEHAEAITSDLINKHKEVTKQYKEFKDTLNDLASEGRLGRKLNTHGTVETVLDSIPNEKIVQKMFDPKNSAGLGTLKEKFPEVFKTLVDNKKSEILSAAMKDGAPDVNKTLKELDKLSPEIKKLMFSPEELSKLKSSKVWVESLPKNVGPSGTPKGMSFMDALKNPVSTMLANAKDYGIKQLLRFSSPQEANKTMFMINAEKQGLRSMDKIKSGVSDVLEKSSGAVRPMTGLISSKITSTDEYKDKTKQIASLANDPMNMHDKISNITEPMYEHAPNFTGSMQRGLMNGVSFLNSKIPQQNKGLFVKEQDPTPTDMAKFNRYYSLVENPHHVLKQIQDGTLSNESMEVMNSVYPKLYAQMKSEMMNQVSEKKDVQELPYQTKMMLSKFLGEPIHPSMTPQSIAMNQNVYATSPQQQALKQPKSSQTGLEKMNLAKQISLRPNDEV